VQSLLNKLFSFIFNNYSFFKLYFLLKIQIFMKKNFTLIALACIAISIQSCKKEKDSNPTTPTPVAKECRATAITSNGVTHSFTYNNDGKVSQIVTSGTAGYTKTFTYNGNTINIISKSGKTVSSKSVITTNTAGNIS